LIPQCGLNFDLAKRFGRRLFLAPQLQFG